MSNITKTYTGEISVDIAEFDNDQILSSLETRRLSKEQQEVLFQITESYKPKEIFFSDYVGEFSDFVQKAISEKKIAVVDRDVVITKQVVIEGDLTIRALDNIKIEISSDVLNGFLLKTGIHMIKNFKTTHLNAEGTHYTTDRTFNILWTNHFENVQMNGGKYGYDSSRGGTSEHMNITTMVNTLIDVSGICISVFSQDGPFKALHLYNATFKSVISHNIYVHPSVSLHYVGVKTLGAGKLMQHQYSGSGNGGYNTGLYSYFEKVDVTLPNTGTTYDRYAAFEMTTLANDNPIIIKDSKIGPYVTSGVKPAIVDAVNTQFVNAGNGIFLRGKITNCTGGVWSSNGNIIIVENSNLSEISYRGGGTLIANKCTISNIWGADRGNNFELTFNNCAIGTMYEGGLGFGIINLNNTTVGRYTPVNFRTDLLNIIN